ncbi:MAG: aminoacyl-tRNA hydrolase [Pseudarcicella sp.]|nr:aminoacyl-tRNA hydrolase [Pseudarcicella sp.]MBP6411367.1 aminoacyl-tRNA hydrolase [Pseudarcicella sp.]
MTIFDEITKNKLSKEFTFQYTKSSGPGGQNVNKVASKVELRFDIKNSEFLTEEQKLILINTHKNQTNIQSEWIITSQETRSQVKNKEIVIEKFFNKIELALQPIIIRKKSKTPKKAIENRLKSKKLNSILKYLRRNIKEM